MSTKHTPGPWTVTVNGIKSPDGHIVFFDKSGGPHESDAKLIAAAPDLLAALDEMVNTGGWMASDPRAIAARAAIAKATI